MRDPRTTWVSYLFNPLVCFTIRRWAGAYIFPVAFPLLFSEKEHENFEKVSVEILESLFFDLVFLNATEKIPI